MNMHAVITAIIVVEMVYVCQVTCWLMRKTLALMTVMRERATLLMLVVIMRMLIIKQAGHDDDGGW